MVSSTQGGKAELRIQARSKINLGLHIKGLRPDGYHEIWSILQEIRQPADELILRETPDFSLSLACDHPDLPIDQSNLCLRAAQALREHTNYPRGALIHLSKRIPLGAGLGGGSADAAAVFKGLNQLWGLGLDQETLLKLAASIGSDVPFFILGGCCVATGRGEVLQKIEPVIQDQVLLVCPPEQVSTVWAYKNIENYHLTQGKENVIFFGSEQCSSRAEFYKQFSNDFEPLVFAHYPQLGKIKERLMAEGAVFASLSGSGSTVYAIFQHEEEAQRVARSLPGEYQIYLIEI